MSHVVVARSHALGADEARARVKKFEDKLKARFGITLSWNGNQATFKGKGVSGDARVDETAIQINLKLALLARPFAGKIKSAIEQSLDKELSA